MSDPNFLPYVLNVIQPLKELFLQDRFQEIPTFHLKPNSDFHLVASNVASLAVTQSITDDQSEQTSKIFDSIAEYVQDPRNLARLQVIEHASKNFAAILENSYTTLTNLITPTVDDLRTQIEKRYIDLVHQEKAEDLLASDQVAEPSEANYRFVTWDKLLSPSKQSEIVEIACSNANITKTDLSLINLNYIIEKMFFSGHQPINLPEEVKAEVLKRMTSTFATATYGITGDQVKNFLDIATSPQNYSIAVANFKRSIIDYPHLADVLVSTNQLSNAFMTMADATLRVVGDNLGPDSQAVLAKNLEIIKKTTYAIQYWLLTMKEIRLKGRLILSKDVLNQEVYEEFVRDGNSIIDIHNFIKAFYLEAQVPKDGIGAERVKTTNVREKLEKTAMKLKFNATFIKSKCLIRAYEYVMQKFITDTIALERYPKLQEDHVVKRFTALAANRVNTLGGDIAKTDAALYDVIVNAFHREDLIGTLYKYLGTNFDNLANESEGDITDEEITKAQCWASIEMLTDYLFNTLVETKDNFKPLHNFADNYGEHGKAVATAAIDNH